MSELRIIEGGPDFTQKDAQSEALRGLFAAMDKGDIAARDRLWADIQKALEPTVRAHVRWRVRGREEIVDEIMNETFLSVFAHLDSYDRNTNFSAWVKAIAGNRAIDYLRKSLGRTGKKREEMLEDLGRGGEVVGVLEEKDTPESLIQKSETDESFLLGFSTLPERTQQAIILREILEIPGNRVGKILGLSEARVSQLIKKGKEDVAHAIRGGTRPESPMTPAQYRDLVSKLSEEADRLETEAA
jgi:RNA polymerase sigma-70 factor (ECF subfamily)